MNTKKIFIAICVIGLFAFPMTSDSKTMEDHVEGHTGFQARVSEKLGISEEDFAVCIERSKPGSTWEKDNTTHDPNFEKNHPNMTKVKYTKERESKVTLLKCLKEHLPNLTQRKLNEAMK